MFTTSSHLNRYFSWLLLKAVGREESKRGGGDIETYTQGKDRKVIPFYINLCEWHVSLNSLCCYRRVSHPFPPPSPSIPPSIPFISSYTFLVSLSHPNDDPIFVVKERTSPPLISVSWKRGWSRMASSLSSSLLSLLSSCLLEVTFAACESGFEKLLHCLLLPFIVAHAERRRKRRKRKEDERGSVFEGKRTRTEVMRRKNCLLFTLCPLFFYFIPSFICVSLLLQSSSRRCYCCCNCSVTWRGSARKILHMEEKQPREKKMRSLGKRRFRGRVKERRRRTLIWHKQQHEGHILRQKPTSRVTGKMWQHKKKGRNRLS